MGLRLLHACRQPHLPAGVGGPALVGAIGHAKRSDLIQQEGLAERHVKDELQQAVGGPYGSWRRAGRGRELQIIDRST